jgi:REP element-mobilizing transposase RayT
VPSTYLSINLHVIFATKLRAPMIGDSWRAEFHAYIAGVFRGQGVSVATVGGVADHVHALVEIDSKTRLGDVMGEVKKTTSVWAAQRYHAFQWQTGYAALSVSGSDRHRVISYIVGQEEHHRTRTSADELRELLAEHGIPVDERYFE